MADLRQAEIDRAIALAVTGQGLLIVGEEGSGKTWIAERVEAELLSVGWKVARAVYTGSAKETLEELAIGLDIDPAQKSADLKAAIALELTGDRRLLIADNAHHWPQSLKLWMGILWQKKAVLLLLATNPPRTGIFLKLMRININSLNENQIRGVMYQEAQAIGLSLSASRAAEIQHLAGGNPALAKRIVRETAHEITTGDGGDHAEYLDLSPIFLAVLSAISVIRFIGLGLGDRQLYIFGGIAMVVFFVARQIWYGMPRKRSPKLGA